MQCKGTALAACVIFLVFRALGLIRNARRSRGAASLS